MLPPERGASAPKLGFRFPNRDILFLTAAVFLPGHIEIPCCRNRVNLYWLNVVNIMACDSPQKTSSLVPPLLLFVFSMLVHTLYMGTFDSFIFDPMPRTLVLASMGSGTTSLASELRGVGLQYSHEGVEGEEGSVSWIHILQLLPYSPSKIGADERGWRSVARLWKEEEGEEERARLTLLITLASLAHLPQLNYANHGSRRLGILSYLQGRTVGTRSYAVQTSVINIARAGNAGGAFAGRFWRGTWVAVIVRVRGSAMWCSTRL